MTVSGKPNSAAVPWQRDSVSASVFGGVWILLPISFIYQSDVYQCGDCIIPYCATRGRDATWTSYL
ncbi:uncharacterized protein P174DRAFT_441839 [Aspergillus novofumigatus IBT 16806]|uniref:Uncharacterized protein n=1 Tax=Aspergillus novofumigatus (strain IBT 16806) TaxID=1392255 RepID=A0A2I1CAB1_ASPN1|nr:uncharacterized protein P174DRAFT_441839 [Aspergillus novofumigatus IBT 16806]PKX94536.1 hypothetical protein P174DRAFT_441839 [Aspergillus novofumigatus IBT 16806]